MFHSLKTVAAAGYNKSSNIVLDICGMVQMRRLWFNFVYPFVYDIACLGTMMFFLLRMPEKSDLKSFLVSQVSIGDPVRAIWLTISLLERDLQC